MLGSPSWLEPIPTIFQPPLGQGSENRPFDENGPSACRVVSLACRVSASQLASLGMAFVVTNKDWVNQRRNGFSAT